MPVKELPKQKRDERPAEYFDRFHQSVRQNDPFLVYEACRAVLAPTMFLGFRLEVFGRENIVKHGGVIYAPDHHSNWDHFVVAAPLRRRVHFMAKSNMFVPPLEWILYQGGCFPVRRGQSDAEAMITAKSVLLRGNVLVMYPSGGRQRNGESRARSGVGRLALETGLPVVPVGLYNTDKIREVGVPKLGVYFGQPQYYGLVENPSYEEAQWVAEDVASRNNMLNARLADRMEVPRSHLSPEEAVRIGLATGGALAAAGLLKKAIRK